MSETARRYPHGVTSWVDVEQRDVADWSTTIEVPGYGQHLASTVDPDIYERQANAPEGFADVIGAVVQLQGDRRVPCSPPASSPGPTTSELSGAGLPWLNPG